ncbi:MAG: DMT family transporter [Chloroflexi bacterium]|nr:MAG: DMT family transporter [Chloroflexota bacterium]
MLIPFLGELAALGTAVCWSGTATFFSYSGRLVGSQVVNRTRLLFAMLFLMISHLLLEGSWFPFEAEGFRWFWFTVSSVLGLVIGDSLLFKSFVLLGARLSTLMMATVPIISAVFGWLLFGETLTAIEILGVVLTVAAVGWVVTEKQANQSDNDKRDYKRGVWFGLGGAVGQVLNLVTAKYGLVGDYSTVSATTIRIFVAMVVLWLVAAVQGEAKHTIAQWRNRQAMPAIVAGSFVGPFLGIWLSLVAIQYARLGIASTLMALPPIMLIPVEYFILKKPISLRGVAGSAAAIAGVALIFLS